MKKKNHIPLIILVLLFALGLGLRLYRLNLNSPPLYADETGQYVVLQNILHHHTNPIEFLINISFSFTWLFGLTPLGVRFGSAVYGSLSVILFYFLGLAISKGRQSVGLTYSLLAAVLPWGIILSRLGLTHIGVIILFTSLHHYLYLRSRRIIDYLVCLLPLIIATIYYPTVLVALPFILFLVIRDILGILKKKYHLPFLGLLLIIFIAFGTFVSIRSKIFSPSGRALDLAIWRDINTPWEIDKYRSLSWNSSPSLFSFGLAPETLANKLVYNRVMANIQTFLRNYLSFFSSDWLFLRGDPILRHSTGQVGTFYPFLIPFMLIGIYIFFRTADAKVRNIFLIWLITSPLPAALTKDGFGYLLRVATLLPFLTYFCALGIVESFNLIRKNWQIPYGAALSFIGLYSAYYFFFGYFHVYPSLSARSFEYGFKELSDYQVAQANAPLLVIWDGYYHNNDFRFWQNTPYDQFKAFKLKEVVIGESHFYQTFTNLYFVKPQSVKDLQEFVKTNHPSFIVLPDRYFVNYPPELDKIYSSPSAVIKYPDQTPALKIFKL